MSAAELDYDPNIDPFAGMETVASSVQHYGLGDREGEHRVRLSTSVRRGRCTFYVWECACGVSSPLHTSPGLANESYLQHKAAGA